jgi:hypothetical protein
MVTDEATPQPAAPEVGPDQKAAAAPDVSAAEAAVLGLALSGGGVRAALFSLGVVVGLIATGCHRRVRCVASVSGGSILNAALAHGDRLAGLSDVTAFEPLASNLAASLASRGVFAFSLRTVGSAAWYLARVVARAIVPLAIGVPLMLAKLADVLRDDFKLDLSQFDYRSLPWEALGWVMLASLLISALLSRGLFQEARFGSVLSSVASHRGRLNVEEWGKKGKGPDVMHVLRGDGPVIRRADVFLEQIYLLQTLWMEHSEEHWHCRGSLQLGGLSGGVSPQNAENKKVEFSERRYAGTVAAHSSTRRRRGLQQSWERLVRDPQEAVADVAASALAVWRARRGAVGDRTQECNHRQCRRPEPQSSLAFSVHDVGSHHVRTL